MGIEEGSYRSEPILLGFLVPKPHGHGMRAVLDFRKVNAASVSDGYTIWEVLDCVEKIGLACSSVFSSIDLTSRFWQQSLNPASSICQERHLTFS